MDAIHGTLKKPSKIALAALGILLVGAIVFFKERLFFADSSFVVFSIINNKALAIQNQRYGSFITQIVPYLGQKLDLPITSLLIGYALSFNLFFVSVCALLVYRYKQYGLAILMALYYFLFVSDSFFWVYDELQQAIAWMFLFFAVIIYLGHKRVHISVLLAPFLILAFLTVSTHFIAIITTIFLWVYFIIEKKNWPFSPNITILLSALLVAVIVFKFETTQSQPYENEHLHGLTHFSIKDLIGIFSTPVIKMFFYRCIVNYWLAVLLFIVSITSLYISKQKLLAAWTLLSCLGYIMLMSITYAGFDKNVLLFHIETEWQSLGIIIAAPFVFTFLPKLKTSYAMILLTVIFITRLAYMASAIPVFSWRTQFKDRVMAQMKKRELLN